MDGPMPDPASLETEGDDDVVGNLFGAHCYECD